MNKARANKRFLIVAAASLLTGIFLSLGIFGASGGLNKIGEASLLVLVVKLAFGALLALVIAMGLLASYAFFVLGWMRIRDDALELEELSDENVVGDPEDGERKLNEYLSAITSMEARIGLLQRSAPYVPPERRPPPDIKPPRTGLTRTGKRIFGTVLCSGAIAGIGIALINGAWEPPNPSEGFQPVVLVRLGAAGLVGLLLSMPVALLLAAFHIEYKEPDDAGGDRPEAA